MNEWGGPNQQTCPGRRDHGPHSVDTAGAGASDAYEQMIQRNGNRWGNRRRSSFDAICYDGDSRAY